MQPEKNDLNEANGLENSTIQSTITPVVDARVSVFRYNKTAFTVTAVAFVLLLLVGIGGFILSQITGNNKPTPSTGYKITQPSLAATSTESPVLKLGNADTLVVNGQLKVANTLVLSPDTIPKNPIAGQVYYDKTANAPYYYNGTSFVSLAPTVAPQSVTNIGGTSGAISVGNGLQVTSGVLALSATTQQLLTSPRVTSISGTPGQINTSGSTGDILLTLPQNIDAIASPTFTDLNLTSASGNTVTIQGIGTLGQNTTYTLPDPGLGTATICLNTGNCAGSGTGITGLGTVNTIALFSGSQAIGDSILSQDAAATTLMVTGQIVTTGDIDTVGMYRVNGTQIGSTNLNDGTNLAKLSGSGPQVFTGNNKFTGTFVVQNGTNATNSFQVQNAAGASIFSVDTVNGRIGINNTLPSYALDVNGDINSNTAVRIGGVAVCTTACIPASGSNNYIQNGTSVQDNANISIRSTAINAVTALIQGANGQTADILQIQSWNGTSATSVAKFASDGATTFAASSTQAAVTIQQAAAGTSGSLVSFVSGTTNPTEFGNITGMGLKEKGTVSGLSSQSIAISGRYAYTASNLGINITDIADPNNPVIVGTLTDATYLNNVTNIAVAGRYAYVISRSTSSFMVIDVSNPSNPIQISVTKSSGLSGSAGVESLAVSGKYVYVALRDGSKAIITIDVSNPAAPVFASSFKDPVNMNGPNSLAVSGRYAYTANYFGNGFSVIDIANPIKPALVSSITDVTALYAPVSLYVSGRYAYVGTTNGLITTVDISNPGSPAIVGSVAVPVGSPLNNIQVAGHYLYGVGGISDTMVYDIANPTTPTLVAMNTGTNFSCIRGLAIAGRYAYTGSVSCGAGYGPAGLTILELAGLDIPNAQIGSLQASTITTWDSIDVGNSLTVKNGLSVGASIQAAGNLGVTGGATIQGSTVLSGGSNLLTAPAAPTIAFTGTPGTNTTYRYTVAALNSTGGSTTASAVGSILTGDTGFTSMNASNYNTIAWQPVAGAASYNIYRTIGGNSTGLIGNTSGTSYDDTGIYAVGTPPANNTTSQLTVQGSVLVQNKVDSTAAFQVQSAAGTSIFNVDSSASQVTIRGANTDGTLGSQLVATTNFTNAAWTSAGWTTTTTTATHTTGNTSPLTTNQFVPVVGSEYEVTFTVTGNPTAGEYVIPSLGGTAGGPVYGNSAAQTISFSASTTTPGLSFTPTANWNGTISAVTVKLKTRAQAVVTIADSTGATSLEIRATASAKLNTFVGYSAGASTVTGFRNSGFGVNALVNNSSGAYNSAFGVNALVGSTSGSNNTALGYKTLTANTSGSNNTALGSLAGTSYEGAYGTTSNSTGNNNTYVGYAASSGVITQLQNSTALGTYSSVNSNDSLVLGCVAGVGLCATTTNIGIGVSDVQSRLQVQSNSITGTGTITGTSTSIVGTGTTFTAQTRVGDTIIVANQSRRITAIANDTSLTVDTPFGTTIAAAAYKITTPLQSVSATGVTTFKNSTNSTAAFQVQSATGTALFTADTTNMRVTVQALVVTATLTINGHLVSGNASGSTTAGIATAVGSTGNCALNPANFTVANDTSGTIVITPNGTGITAGTQCTVNFASAYASFPHVVVSPADSNSAGRSAYAAAASATTFTIGFANAGTAATPYTFNYFISQ